MEDTSTLCWVVLTMGARPGELQAALDSVAGPSGRSAKMATLVCNGCEVETSTNARRIALPQNIGVPGGRDVGLRSGASSLVGFLDDDAILCDGGGQAIVHAFESDGQLGAVALRIVDEHGETSRRHVPRFGGRDPERGGDVALFLGGACAIRREAYDDVGGYFTDLFYGHEEVELCWRLVDRGWTIRYLPEATVFHPRTDVGRHPEGWFMTGRNRVWIARRTLPWPVAVVHVVAWLGLGLVRAPGRTNRTAYLRGWWSGWSQPVDRRPISWPAVWRLTRLGRPPVL